jgi:DNA-binding CsgD family transcriptional regulator
VSANIELTARQEQICGLLRQGMSNKMIAGTLGISEGTVKNHVTEILRALKATNRTQAAQLDRTDMFDTEESMHLALHANAAGDVRSCMKHLKEVLRQQPRNATALWLLAVQHAELGMYERAVAGMKAALGIQPRLEVARFQLGLLLMDGKQPREAREQFSALAGSSDRALQMYAEALTAVLDRNESRAREKLTAGLQHKSGNPALSASMRRLLERLSKGDNAPEGADASENRVFLGAYRQAPS